MTYKLILIFAMTASVIHNNLFAHENPYINKPCVNTEIDSEYIIKFDDAILAHVDLNETVKFLEKNYKESVILIDNEYVNGKDSLHTFASSKISASAYKRTGDNEVVSLCVKIDENIPEIIKKLVPPKYLMGNGDESMLIIDESSTVKAYISYKSGRIVKLKLFHIST